MPKKVKDTTYEVKVIPCDLPKEEQDRNREAALDCLWTVLVRSRKRRGLLPQDFPEER